MIPGFQIYFSPICNCC